MATAVVEIGSEQVSEPSGRRFISVTVKCSECDYATYTGGDPDRDWSHLIDGHLAQHEPDRALDIEVDWEPSASCSVCEDGGDVVYEDDGLMCRDCRTHWDIDGKSGYRAETEAATNG